jgi:hypothetical protein
MTSSPRAVLHHVPSPALAVRRTAAALKPGGVLLSIEPDMLSATVAEPESMRAFWNGWLKWSVTEGIDYLLGRKMPAIFAEQRLQQIGAEGHTAYFQGASLWASFWTQTIQELAPGII